ncbi:ephrin type-B receptor 1-A-like [Haliotis rubra]|uniref:ephrin type-B receptor 1-A-like n=1 Tax=Haliotis rubra TaxID=36100 RepID=UPI001EE628C6|nr:ephrin type-B receptor 1-A-like [Haliotis rubra]
MERNVFVFILFAGAVTCVREDVIFDMQALDKLGWDKFTTSGRSEWTEVTQKTNKRLHKVYSVCSKRDAKVKDWVITPPIPTNGSDTVYLKLKYSIRECLGEDVPVCHIDMYSYQSTTDVPIPIYSNWDHLKYINTSAPISDVTSVVEVNELSMAIPLRNTGNKISFGFKDEGSCSKIISLKVSVIFCEAVTTSMMTFPETSTMTSDRVVNGECIDNAEAATPEIQSVCKPDGTWGEVTGECACVEGYEKEGEKCSEIVVSACGTTSLSTVAMTTLLFLSMPWI